MRIAPMFVLAKFVEIFSLNGLVGHGIDSTAGFMSYHIAGLKSGVGGGGLASVWYDYGFITFSLFVAFTLKAVDALESAANFGLWVVVVFLSPMNNQMVWLFVILFSTLSYYRNPGERVFFRRLSWY